MEYGYQQTALFEHRFWLQILRDHAEFIHDTLAPEETEEIAEARSFISTFDTLFKHAKQSGDLIALSKQAKKSAQKLRHFKLHLIKRHLTGKIKIGLSPTFINHMVNELEEYLRILAKLTKGKMPPIQHPIHHHLLWLSDAAGHAGSIHDELDLSEKRLKRKSASFTHHFEDFYLKAVEMAGYLRTSLPDFPALQRFNHETKLEMALFRSFLQELEEWRLDNQVLGVLSPLMADHMAREECYYLVKLAESTCTKPPDCNPFNPQTR